MSKATPGPFRARGAHLRSKLPCEMWREVLSCGGAATLSHRLATTSWAQVQQKAMSIWSTPLTIASQAAAAQEGILR